jgi:hypothetical protein
MIIHVDREIVFGGAEIRVFGRVSIKADSAAGGSANPVVSQHHRFMHSAVD